MLLYDARLCICRCIMYFCCCVDLSYCCCSAACSAVGSHRVPGDTINVFFGLLHLISVFYSLHSITIFFYCIPLSGIYCRVYRLDLPMIRMHARSVICGLAWSQGGLHPAALKLSTNTWCKYTAVLICRNETRHRSTWQ